MCFINQDHNDYGDDADDAADDADDDDEYDDDCGVRLRPNHISGSPLDPLHLSRLSRLEI